MTKIYTLLLLCLFALTLPVTAREAEFKKIKESWTLQADGTQVYRQSKVLTLYTHTAMNRTYGESFITYDPRYQTLQIHESYTRQKDGNIVKTPTNALVEVLPSAAANAPGWNSELPSIWTIPLQPNRDICRGFRSAGCWSTLRR